jgi:hypothetical protein
MGQLSSAIAPLVPIFDIVGAVISVKDFAQAVVTNPFSAGDAIGDLLERVDKLAQLVPQLSVPFLIVDSINALIAYATGLDSELAALERQESNIRTARELAGVGGNDALGPIVDCAEDQLYAHFENLKGGAGPADLLIKTLNILVAMVPGCPPIPTLGDIGDSVLEAREAMRSTRDILLNITRYLPSLTDN